MFPAQRDRARARAGSWPDPSLGQVRFTRAEHSGKSATNDHKQTDSPLSNLPVFFPILDPFFFFLFIFLSNFSRPTLFIIILLPIFSTELRISLDFPFFFNNSLTIFQESVLPFLLDSIFIRGIDMI